MRSSQRIFAIALAAVLATGLAGCNEKRDPGFQGWVEADMIYVSPDEAGRVTKLDIREGDEVKVGDHPYSVDDDLQLADLNQNKATLANAQQVFDRADSLRKTGSGTQATLDSAVSDLARRTSAGGDLGDADGAAQGFCAGRRHHPADLFPRGRDGGGAAAGALDHAARQHEAALLRAGNGAAEACRSATRCGSPATIARPISPQRSISLRPRPNTPRR